MQYKKSVENYSKQLKEAQNRGYYNPRIHNPEGKPEFISEVSEEGIKRIIVILDVVFKALESLGGHVNTDLSMKIKNDYEGIKSNYLKQCEIASSTIKDIINKKAIEKLFIIK